MVEEREQDAGAQIVGPVSLLGIAGDASHAEGVIPDQVAANGLQESRLPHSGRGFDEEKLALPAGQRFERFGDDGHLLVATGDAGRLQPVEGGLGEDRRGVDLRKGGGLVLSGVLGVE